jgi:hypothetical protein
MHVGGGVVVLLVRAATPAHASCDASKLLISFSLSLSLSLCLFLCISCFVPLVHVVLHRYGSYQTNQT